MKTWGTAVVLGLAVLVAGVVSAADKKEKKVEKKAPPCPAMQAVERMATGLTLTDEQKAKCGELCKEFGPKLMDAMKKGNVLTPEQQKAGAEARKAAQAAGKTGKEAADAYAAAVKMTDDQKTAQDASRKEVGGLQKDLRDKVMGMLTAEQKDQMKKIADEARKKAIEAKKAAEAKK